MSTNLNEIEDYDQNQDLVELIRKLLGQGEHSDEELIQYSESIRELSVLLYKVIKIQGISEH